MMNKKHTLSFSENTDLVARLQRDIKEEIFKAIKISKTFLLRNALNPLVNLPSRRFAELFASLDGIIKEKGIASAAQYALSQLSDKVVSNGEVFIPREGPLIIASNHPGTYDGLAIISHLPRNDAKLIVSGVPFFRDLPNASNHLIYATRDTFDRMDVIRKSIRHLKQGGTLLFFPSGKIDPDPSVLPGAGDSLQLWSRSLEIFLRKVPDVNLVLTITSGVLSKEFINHPLTRFFSKGHERRRVMEFMQVIRQMVRRMPVNISPKVSFERPLHSSELIDESGNQLNSLILAKTQQLLADHIERYYAGVRI